MRTLKEIREEMGLTVSLMAIKVDVSDTTIRKIENGLPVRENIKLKIAKALKLPLSEIEFFEVHRY